jgi:hypothetical protein
VLLLRHLQSRVSSYRSAAQRPLVPHPRAPPPLSAEESSQVHSLSSFLHSPTYMAMCAFSRSLPPLFFLPPPYL